MGLLDPMKFEQLRDNIIALLVANQATYFRTVLGQKQRTDAEEVKKYLRTVQVFNESGEYDDRSSGKQTKEHNCEYRIEYKLSRAAEADLTVLDDESATPDQLQAALSAADEATALADKGMDELRRMVSQILLDPKNRAMGFDDTPSETGKINYTVSRPQLTNYRKNQPLRVGGLVLLTASETFKATVTETFDGADVTLAATNPIDTETGISNADGDPTTDPTLFGVES